MVEMIKLTPKEWRKAKGYSIVEMAKKLDIAPVTYTKYEVEPSLMPLGKADLFCKIIGVSQDEVSFLP